MNLDIKLKNIQIKKFKRIRDDNFNKLFLSKKRWVYMFNEKLNIEPIQDEFH